MSIQYARDFVNRLGPGRIALDRSLYEDLAIELALNGCEVRDLADEPRSGVVLLDWSRSDDGATTLARAAGFDILALLPGQAERPDIDRALFDAGWRRHPGGMLPGAAGEWSDQALPATAFYDRAEAGRCAGPLRSRDARADWFVARYAHLSTLVRPGDTVLVDDDEADDAIAILSALSSGHEFLAGGGPAAEGEIFRLDAVADNSVGLVLAFDPPMDNWQIALAEYARVLRLDGRIVVGWRKGPPGDSRPSNWAELVDFAEQLFLIEARYVHDDSGRIFGPFDLDAGDTSWRILGGSANPLDGADRREEYTHPAFGRGSSQPSVVDFRGGYDNPWLQRTMVQIGERFSDVAKLARIAEFAISRSRPESADRGAALSVFGYRLLEMRDRAAVPAMLGQIEDYFTETPGSQPPFVTRWRISLAYLAGRLAELIEDRDGALSWYDRCAGEDWSNFSPILATKTIGAAFYAGRLRLASRDREGATARFRHGVETGLKVAAADHGAQLGDPDSPLPFYFQELAEVFDMASQCVNALASLPLLDRDPGLYWRQVDVRRFGLHNWAQDLQVENDRLRKMR